MPTRRKDDQERLQSHGEAIAALEVGLENTATAVQEIKSAILAHMTKEEVHNMFKTYF